MFRTLIVILFTIVCLISFVSGPSEKKAEHFITVGYDCCSTILYYFVHNSYDYCLGTNTGLFLSLIFGLIYFTSCFVGLPLLLWLAIHPDRI